MKRLMWGLLGPPAVGIAAFGMACTALGAWVLQKGRRHAP